MPQSYFNSKEPYGLVFAFHGLTGVCTEFGPSRGFIQYTDSLKFIFVYPCGYKGILGTAWNAGTCCLRGYNVDDNDLTKKMITQMQANFRINSTRIFATGFSNGGMISETLACQNPGLFRAIASVGGANVMLPGNKEGMQNCDKAYAAGNGANSAKTTTAVLLVHGDADPTVKWKGDALLGFPPTMDDFAAWAKRNKCSGNPVNTFKYAKFENQLYKSCAYNTQVEVVRNLGGLHKWPADNTFNTTQYIMNFFHRFGL